MGRRLATFLAIFLFIVAFSVSPSFAQEAGQSAELNEEGVMAPDYILPPGPEPGFLGQDHSYTVVFRGNGEAVVSVKVVFANKGEEGLSEVNLRVPKVEPKNISVYQVIKERRCINYGPRVYNPITGTYQTGECLQYQEPDYYQGYYGAKYQKAEYEYSGDTISITLPRAVKPEASGSFFVYFRAFGYAKKNIFGVYKYTFESLKVEDDIRSLSVGISTDSDLVLKGVKGEVSYRFEEPALAGLGEAAVPQKSAAIDSYYNQIGQGRITKTASNLSPLESYKATGSYAKNRLSLYGKEISIGLAIFLVLSGIVLVVMRCVFRKLRKAEVDVKKSPKDAGLGVSETTRLILVSTGVGLASSLLMAGYTVAVMFLGSLLTSAVGYRYNFLVVLFLVIISFCIYALLLFGPAIYFGVRKGVGWGIAAMILTVFWLVVFLVIAILILFLLGDLGSSSSIRPIPLIESFSQ